MANVPYLLTMHSGLEGFRMIQDFTYYTTTVSMADPAGELVAAFIDQVVPKIIAVLHESTPINSLVARNLLAPVDYQETNLLTDNVGLRTGAISVAFVALAFSSAKPAINQRPARKRFGYVSSADLAGIAVANVSGMHAAMDALAAQLGTPLKNESDDDIFIPSILKRIPYTTESGKTAYRFPATSGEVVQFNAESWDWAANVTSQITRKADRGI